MKKISILGMLAACAVMAASCAKESTTTSDVVPDGMVPVKFSMQTNGVMTAVTKAPTSTYTVDGFRVFAFKQSGNDWVFFDEMDLTNPTYASSGGSGTFSGTAYMTPGVYRFIPTYGLNGTGPDYTVGNFTDGYIWDDASPVLVSQSAGSMPEVFTLVAGENGFNDIANFTVTLGSAPDYTSAISRAVARLDIMIVRATGTVDAPVEAANATSVFGDKTLATASIELPGANSSMNFLGTTTASSTFDLAYTIEDAALATDVMIGTGAAAVYGTAGYQGYNAVVASDILQGGAFMYGPFLAPNADATPTQSATLNFTDADGNVRTVTIAEGQIPLQANYVTTIKIYLLENADETIPPDIWSENVNFAVTMTTDYAGNTEVNGGVLSGE